MVENVFSAVSSIRRNAMETQETSKQIIAASVQALIEDQRALFSSYKPLQGLLDFVISQALR